MNFAKWIFVLGFSAVAFCDATPFSVATPIPPNSDGDEKTISFLKQQAVSEWLQGFLGQKFGQFEKSVTLDFAEKYILDYSISRPSAQPPQLVLSGHIDDDALRKWVRVHESRSKSSPNRTLFLMSSQLPGSHFPPSETLSQGKDSVLGAQIQQMIVPHLSKLGGIIVYGQSGAPNALPPGSVNQMRDLKNYGDKQGANYAVWANIGPCPSCIGSRLEIFLYQLAPPKIETVISEDLPLQAKDAAIADSLKTHFAPLAQQFQSDLEGLVVAAGTSSRNYRIIIENVNSYRGYKELEQALLKREYLSRLVMARAARQVAEFEVESTLSLDELSAKLQEMEFQGHRLAVSKIDNSSLVARIQ